MRRINTLLILLAFALLLSIGLCAQDDVNLEQGTKPYGSYLGSDIDSVSLTNGNLNLHIPLVSYPQRGGRLKLSFFLRYNNKGCHQSGGTWVCDDVGVDVAREQVIEQRASRTTFSVPVSGQTTNEPVTVTSFSVVTADGGMHPTGASADAKSSNPGILDGSALGRFGIVDLIDGSQTYQLSGCSGATLWNPLKSIDPNGNFIQTTPTGWIDTLGRNIPGELLGCPITAKNNLHTLRGIPAGQSNNGGLTNTDMRLLPGVASSDFSRCPSNTISARNWDLPGFADSSAASPTVTARITFCYAIFQVSTSFGVPNTTEETAPLTFLQNVVLPNGAMWSFNYNTAGDLSQIVFPTGGSITYNWATFNFCSGYSRAVTSRIVNDDTGQHPWAYHWAPGTRMTTSPFTEFDTTVTVTDPNLNDTFHRSSPLLDCTYYEVQSRSYEGSQGTGKLLKTVDTNYLLIGNPFEQYGNGGGGAAFPQTITTTWSDGRASQVQRTYDVENYTFWNYTCLDCASTPQAVTEQRSNGQIISEKVLDYALGGPGPALRRIDTSYLTLDSPSTITTYDGNGNKCAETDFAYDDSMHLVPTTVTQNHSSPSSGTVRANLSSTTRWLTNNPCSSIATWSSIVTYTDYNDTGTLASATDALSNATQYSYSDLFYGAYLTQTQFPNTGTVAHIIKGDYDFNTGLLRTYTDQNNNSSHYSYDDMRRVVSSSYPDTGQIQFYYPNITTVEKRQLEDSNTNTWIDQFTYFDLLGRQKQTQLIDSQEGDVFSELTYDGIGLQHSVTNAHRSTGAATDGIKTSKYDGLGRITDLTKQDGNIVHTDYPGASAVVTDEAGRQRRTVPDGLGRIVEVDEQASSQADLTIPFGSGATGTVTIVGFENSTTIDPCADQEPTIGSPPPSCPRTIYDSGSVTITVNGHADSAGYGINSDSNSVASDLASAINADGSAFVTAQASGSSVILTAKQLGPSIQYAWSVTSATNDVTDFGSASFSASPASGAMGGGKDPFNGGPVYITLYGYDPLGNLVHVEQHGNTTDSTQWRIRTFTYDSLSRLLTATNPESGTTQYQYDAESNLVLRTDARGIITNYSPSGATIDALHRVHMKTYSDGTPSVTFGYDVGCCGVNPQNGVGRMTYAVAGNTELVYVYDTMGRIITQADCPPSGIARGFCYSISAGYNQVGAIKDLFYPSGRQVHTSYTSAGRLLSAVMTGFNGTPINYTYYSAAQGVSTDANSWGYWPSGAMRLGRFGNSVAELTGYNNRLQVSTISESLPGTTLFSKTYNFYDVSGRDSANVIGINDNLSAAKNQSYSYDTLNRIATASQADNAFNITFSIDPWGNMKESGTSNFNPVFAGDNRIQGWSYDPAGNLLADISHSYSYDAENRITKVDSTAATYTYNPLGNRVRKDVGSNSTEYLVFGGNVISELDQSGNFSDYIYAGGKRIARANNFEHQLHISGQECSNCGWQWYQYNFSNLGTIAGHTIQAGDALRWLQWSNGGSKGGMIITFTDGTESWTTGQDLVDQNGEEIMRGSLSTNQWEYRIANLGPVIGKTISQIRLYADGTTTPGQWDLYFQDLVFTYADESVQSLFSQNPSVPSLSGFGSTGMTQTSATIHDCVGAGCAPVNTTTYYHSDAIGSSRLITDGYGYAVWQGTFLPYGEEYNSQTTTNHYKFTGKERDSESGLDYFGARHYANMLGRWMSADPQAISLRHLANPQKFNKYSYTLNNPTSLFDPNGLEELTIQLRAYIPQANAGPYRGDDRGPTTSQVVTSRTEVTFRIETERSKLPPGYSPLLTPGVGKAGQTENIFTGNKTTQTDGNPGVTSAKFDDKGNVVLRIEQHSVNPLAPPGTAAVRSDLTITIPANASSISTVGTVSASPAFELNVFSDGGQATNIPLQTPSTNTLLFVAGLYMTNSIFDFTPLPPPPPPPPPTPDTTQAAPNEKYQGTVQ